MMEEQQQAPVRRSHRLWLAGLIVAAAAAGIVGLRLVPEDRMSADVAGMYVTFVVAGALAALAAWFVTLSRYALWARMGFLGMLAVAAGLWFAAVRRVDLTGDMQVKLEFRWEPSRDSLLAAHRQQVGEAEALAVDLVAAPGDCPEYRGRARDGVVQSPPLQRDWNSPPPALWRQPVGGGYAAFVVVAGNAITIEQRGPKETVVCYDAATGKEHWRYEYDALFSEQLGGDGPRATPSVAFGKVYTLGATGHLACLEGRTGKPLWEHDILDAAQVANLTWGMSGSPLVCDQLVIVNPGVQKGSENSRGVLAFDAGDGHLVWSAGHTQGSYGSPMLVTLAGARQILIFDAGGLAAHDPGDGHELWRFDWRSDFDINAAQPIALPDDRLLLSSNAGTAVVQVKKSADGKFAVEQRWRNRELKCDYACPVVREGYVYGLDKGILTCLALEDGKRQWKKGRYGHGQMLLSGDLLIVLGEEGQLALVEAQPQKHVELALLNEAVKGRTWNNPALVDGRLYIRNHLEMACYDLRAPGSAPGPAVPQ
ncbi:MAG: PQQ-like beta-propeller repeat protein [Pirellulales bacterium]|nr:PQQ-like beta-propeller repeat protein [Pirellulales bacterium]